MEFSGMAVAPVSFLMGREQKREDVCELFVVDCL